MMGGITKVPGVAATALTVTLEVPAENFRKVNVTIEGVVTWSHDNVCSSGVFYVVVTTCGIDVRSYFCMTGSLFGFATLDLIVHSFITCLIRLLQPKAVKFKEIPQT